MKTSAVPALALLSLLLGACTVEVAGPGDGGYDGGVVYGSGSSGDRDDAVESCVANARDRGYDVQEVTDVDSVRGGYIVELRGRRGGDGDDLVCRYDADDRDADIDLAEDDDNFFSSSRSYGGDDDVERTVDVCTRAAESRGLRVVDILATDENDDHISVDLRVREGGDGTNFNCVYDGRNVRLREKS